MSRARFGLVASLTILLTACGPRPAASTSTSPSSGLEPLTIATSTLPRGEVGLAYAGTQFGATGGTAPYTYQIVEGSLPAGLAVSPADGLVVGTPSASGHFNFSVLVMDSAGHAADALGSIDVLPALVLNASHPATVYVESGCDSVCGQFATQSGGQGPYTYTLKSGALPAGTTLNGMSLAGKFTSTGTYTFTVQVTDALGATANISVSYYVWGRIAFPPSHCDTQVCTADHQYDVLLWPTGLQNTMSGKYPYSGGTPGASPRISVTNWFVGGASSLCPQTGCPPLKGVTVTAANGVVTVTVAGGQNPNLPFGWWQIYVQLTDPATGESTRTAIFRVEN